MPLTRPRMPGAGWITCAARWNRASGDARLALAGYNGGIGVIGRAESLWPRQKRAVMLIGAVGSMPMHSAARRDRHV